MKIGKMKKLLASVLVLSLGFGLMNNNVIRADGGEQYNTEPETDNGLELNKTAKYNPDTRLYDITLDAYTTGTTHKTEKNVPTDIVMVLDQSSSMNEEITIESNIKYSKEQEAYSTTVWDFFDFKENGTYDDTPNDKKYFIYNKEQDKYYPVYLKVNKYWDWGKRMRDVGLYYYDELGNEHLIVEEDQQYFLLYNGIINQWRPGENYEKKKTIPYDLYSYSSDIQKKSKIRALKDTAKNFISKIEESNKKTESTEDDSRVAVVGFANGDKWGYDRYYYENTELFIGDEEYKYDSNEIKTHYKDALTTPEIATQSIDKLTANGGTLIDLGLDIANNVLEKSNDGGVERQKVIVLFTDGQPGWSGFDKDYANKAISNSDVAKRKYNTKVYSVGIFDGANASDESSQANKFMHKVSSNYQNATNLDNGNRVDSKYYMSASNANGLDDIFNSIFDDISKPDIPLDETTVIRDVVSNYFEFDLDSNGNIPRNIKVQRIPCIGKDSAGNYTFAEDNSESIQDITQQVTIKLNDNKTLDVFGYNFDKNYVSIDDNNEPTGAKIRITFSVKPIDGFIGGYDVPTNDGTSGVYSDDVLVETFNLPVTDVPINYHYDTENAGMYITDDWKKFDLMIKNGKYWTTSGNKHNLLNDQYVNDFVDVEYTFSCDEKVLATYTISAGKKEGNWKLNSEFNTSNFTDDLKTITINVEVIPKNEDEFYKVIENVDKEKQANLYIFKPNIKSIDSKSIFLGEKYSSLNSNISLVEWKCNDKNVDVEPTSDRYNNMAPDLVYEFKHQNKIINEFEPKSVGIHEIEYNVYANSKDITAQTKSVHEASIVEHSNCNMKHFYIDVKGGTIKINKSISDSNLNKYDFTNGDPIFGFKIDKLNDNNNVEKTYYRYVRFYKDADGMIAQSSITPLTDLPKGKYRVTEMSSMRFKCDSVLLDNGKLKEDNEISFEISSKKEESDRTVTFTNSLVKDNYFSDTDVVVNSFTTDESGKVVFSQDWLNGKKLINGQSITKLERR